MARAIAQPAELFLFDEPFNGSDRAAEEIIFDVFAELKGQHKTGNFNAIALAKKQNKVAKNRVSESSVRD